MAEFIMLFRGGDQRAMDPNNDGYQAHMEKWVQWMGGLAEQGILLGAQPLHATGKTIMGARKVVTDGPYLEGKEMVGGYLLYKADSIDQATEIAKGCPILEYEDGNVEVRPIQLRPV